ncbi:hypothetical protein EVJ58_g8789 [Rhodofomes roseus]|uniref:NADP-dependent oxidoreductase domain-containing protein n=1 Tax=Rhodofomes roseus TaxID=34475 RepID=A0A4Y9XXQ9_9APHY|nr:hypothetical protein EVJ58_g8789 [Rhodofomes roseus]
MTFGSAGLNSGSVRVSDLKEVEKIIDVFQAHGHVEVDTARVYNKGTSEEYLGKLNWQARGLVVETKLYPSVAWFKPGAANPAGADIPITHSPEDLRTHLDASLKALKADHVELWYLHGPDRTTPYEVTFKAINDLHKEGKFKRLGLSNYLSWEVAEIVQICKANGWIQPTVYQGVYNAIHRSVEPELFRCLRKFGISFYAYNPLGGGFFTGRYTGLESSAEPGSRFDTTMAMGKMYRARYWNDTYFAALAAIQKAGQENGGLTLTEIALRWMNHHSQMKREFSDAIIIGASSLKHIQENMEDLEKGPLPEPVVKALDEAWLSVKGHASGYWH